MPVTHNKSSSQFETHTEHGLARLAYVARGDVLDLVHTEVPGEAEGKGVGSALVEAALAHARRESLRVIPSCPFVRAYLQQHQEFADLVASR